MLNTRMHIPWHAFQDLIDRLEVPWDEAALTATPSRVAGGLRTRWLAYLESSERDCRIISSYPWACVEHYQEQHFERIDPVVKPRVIPRPFFCSDADRWPNLGQRRLFSEARSFGIRCGITVPISIGGHYSAAFTPVGDGPNEDPNRYALEGLDFVQLIGLCFYSHSHTKVRPDLNAIDDAPLAVPELQCFGWAARGKTMADMAEILGISKRTVRFHLARRHADSRRTPHCDWPSLVRRTWPFLGKNRISRKLVVSQRTVGALLQ